MQNALTVTSCAGASSGILSALPMRNVRLAVHRGQQCRQTRASGDDRANLDADVLWVIRGGHFGDGARLVRTTTRGAADPGARRPFSGFRVVLSRATRGR